MRNVDHIKLSCRSKIIHLIASLILAQITIFFFLTTPYAQEPSKKLSCIIHLHSSTYSIEVKGKDCPLETIAKDAAERNIDVIIPTDQALMKFEYGLWPFRNLIKKSFNLTSVLKLGPSNYLAEIDRLSKEMPDLIIIPGVEAAAFYYWSGNIVNGLTLNERNKHMLVIGMENPEDYVKLPVISNTNAGVFNPLLLWPLLLVFLSIPLRNKKILSYLLVLSGLILLINNFPFKDLAFNPYAGSQGEKPYQKLINYANTKGALAYIAHPEAPNYNEPVKIGPVFTTTKPYPESLVNLFDYTGFAIFSEGYRQAGSIGGTWDQALMQYCQGNRDKPVWAIGEVDYIGDKKYLDYIVNILSVKDRTKESVLESLKNGNFFVTLKNFISMDEFYISSGNNIADCGNEIEYEVPVKIMMDIRPANAKTTPVKINIVRNSKLLKTIETNLPARLIYEDKEVLPAGKSYYRIVIDNRLATNPVFVIKR